MELKVITLPVGIYATNCHILCNASGECLVFDAAGEADSLISTVRDEGLKPLAVLQTHAHFDHIMALDEVVDEWKVPVYIHSEEEIALRDPHWNASEMLGVPVRTRATSNMLAGGKEDGMETGSLNVGAFDIQWFHTPGHTKGGVCFLVENHLFSGDSIFQGSIGRSDLPGGNGTQLIEAVKHVLGRIPGGTLIHPGHGPDTTAEIEINTNPFL